MAVTKRNKGLHAFFLVLTTVLLGLVSVWILKETTLKGAISWVAILGVIGLVVFVNGIRFLLWGVIHKRYPLNLSFPINSMFFPLILVMGYFYGEPITTAKVLGATMITVGVALLTLSYAPE